MSLDFVQNRAGLLQLNAMPVQGTTGTASTVGSNQYPAGYGFGAYQGLVAGSNSTNGNAAFVIPIPRGFATTDFQTPASSGTITHDNGQVVLVSVSAGGGVLKLQPAVSQGQLLTLAFLGNASGSIGTAVTTTGFGGTTTAACQVLATAATFGSQGALNFIAVAQLGGTATTNLPYVWLNIGSKQQQRY